LPFIEQAIKNRLLQFFVKSFYRTRTCTCTAVGRSTFAHSKKAHFSMRLQPSRVRLSSNLSLLISLIGLISPIIGALSLPFPAHAATALDLSQALLEGRQKSPQLSRTEAAAAEAQARVGEAFAGYLPRLSLSASHLLSYKYQFLNVAFGGGATVEFPLIVPSTLVSLDLGINVFDGFMTTHSMIAGMRMRDAAQKEADRARIQVENEIRLKFYQALSAQRLADVTDQNVKTLQDHLARSSALVRGGSGTRIDVLRVEVQLSEAIPEQQQAHDNVLLARLYLAQAMGLDKDDRPLEGDLPVPSTKRIPTDLKLDLSDRSDIQALQNRAEAAAQAESAATSIWLPKIGFNAQTQYYNNRDRTFDTSQFRNAYTVAVNLSWNLFDWGLISRYRESSHQYTQVESAARAALLRAPVEFELWKRRYVSNSELYAARKRAIESAEESVRLARLGYEAGTRTGSEVLDTELDLFRARAGAVRAQVDAAEALLNLELALGHTL